MISLEFIDAVITSIFIVTMSLVIFIFINRISKTYGIVIANLQQKILELESLLIENRSQINHLNEKINNLLMEHDSLTTRVYQLETALYEKKEAPRKREESPKKMEVKKETRSRVRLNETEKTILKLLMTGPKTSREIREVLKLSREHIARELKYLYENGYVRRITDTKPFTYEINEEMVEEIESL